MRTIDEVTGEAHATEPTLPRRAIARPLALATGIALAAVAVGVVLRLVRFLADRSLWLDESLLTLNLMTRSYRELVQTLDYNQGAPIGFLWLERLSLDLLGDGEWALRLFPLLVGIASLGIFYYVARDLLDRVGFPVAVVLFATMEPFVRYSAEVKQYGLDVGVGLLLLYLFTRVLERGELHVLGTAVVAVAGPVAVWFSHPSAFVLTGFAAAGVYVALTKRAVRALGRQALAYAVWLAAFLVAYVVAIRDLDELQDTVRGVGGDTGERFKNLYTIFNDPGGFPRTAVGLAAAVALVGVIHLWRRRPAVAVFLGATTSALLAASLLGLYPIGQRFLLFLLPLAVLCLAEGVAGVARNASRLVAAGLLAAVGLLIVVPVTSTAAENLVAPPKLEEAEALLAEIAADWRPGDVLYLYQPSQYAFRYYSECSDCSAVTERARLLWPTRPTAGGQAQTTPAIVSLSSSLVVGASHELEVERLRGNRRVWLLYSHFFPRTERELLEEADRSGTRRRCTHGGASLLCLYDFSGTPPG